MSGVESHLRGQGNPSPIRASLWRELTPTPGRLGATLRLTLACTAATVPIMIHHIPHGLVVMIVMYLITKEDTTATLLGSVLGVIGVTLGFALALLAWQVALETAWRLAFVFLFATMGLYIRRIVVLGAIGSAIGVPAAMAMVLPDILPVPNVEAMTEFVLWLWWCIVLGLAVNLGVQLLLSPGDPLVLLRRALAERLRAAEEATQQLLGRRSTGESPSAQPSLTSLTIAGTSDMLTLLQMASLRHAWARQHRPELGALISLVDQLVTAAAALEASRPVVSGEDLRARLERVAGQCARVARALADTSLQWPTKPTEIELPPVSHAPAIPALAAMERALREIAVAMPRRDKLGLLQGASKPPRKPSLLVPDAFSNPEYAQFALRGGLACLICDVTLVGFNYPGIYTSVITCFVVALSTVGASAQKGILRFAGAAVGGLLGLFALMYILPHVESLGGFWAVFAAGTAVAAWVNFGSPRVSYGGYQIGLAFYKLVLQSWGPVTELTVARDRLVGIAFGLLVFGVLERVLWPVQAGERRQQRFADVLRSLAALARLGAGGRTDAGFDRELEEARRRIAHDLGETQRLLEESKFELEGDEFAVQQHLADAQVIFLVLLSLAYQRGTYGELLRGLPAAGRQLEEAVAKNLQALADSQRTRSVPQTTALDAPLAEVTSALDSMSHGAPTGEAADVVKQYAELCRTLVRLVSQLEPGRATP
ncbi:MAG TPA: FUSC family protein, partial [Candidatus Eisenbacteria bacterium]|nr:FUSC family protein [Candidatus Eisenbacteria bacterium]